ncbi:peptidase [Streptomyces sp. NPDC008313]|uniref:peptidase n=1 Tax=Streptomyces sp. NPDC008313 TaxID=3364826 RepID=UPI0036E7C65F
MATEDIEIAEAGETADAESLSTSAIRTYPVAPGYSLNIRSGPGTHYRILGILPAGSSVPVRCQCPGESVSGPYGTSDIWDNIANGKFVADAYVKTGSDGYIAPRCG